MKKANLERLMKNMQMQFRIAESITLFLPRRDRSLRVSSGQLEKLNKTLSMKLLKKLKED